MAARKILPEANFPKLFSAKGKKVLPEAVSQSFFSTEKKVLPEANFPKLFSAKGKKVLPEAISQSFPSKPAGLRGTKSSCFSMFAGAKKVFVSVGTHPQPFDRLLRELDAVAARHKEIEFFAQTGNSGYAPKNFRFEKFLGGNEYDSRMLWADVVVSHGGAGTIINALLGKKPLVVVPRLAKFGEHTNNHQLDLAGALEEKGKAIAVFGIGDLEKRVLDAFSFRPNLESDRRGLVGRIASFLEAGK